MSADRSEPVMRHGPRKQVGSYSARQRCNANPAHQFARRGKVVACSRFAHQRSTKKARALADSGMIMRKVTMVLVCLMLLAPKSTWAQEPYPSRPVRIVVPVRWRRVRYPRPNDGGQALEQVEPARRRGESTRRRRQCRATQVIQADANGYTVLLGNDTLVINPSLYSKPPFDYQQDFTPISRLVYAPNILVANPSAKLNLFRVFVEQAKQRPGTINVASPGNGSPGHLSLELVKQLAEIDVAHVPYRGAAPAVVDVVSGHVPVGLVGIPPTIGHIRSGALIPVAVTASDRMKALSSVPTLREVGLSKFSVNAWMGFLGPARMPRDVVAKIERDSIESMNDPAIQTRLIELGLKPAPVSGAQLAEMMN